MVNGCKYRTVVQSALQFVSYGTYPQDLSFPCFPLIVNGDVDDEGMLVRFENQEQTAPSVCHWIMAFNAGKWRDLSRPNTPLWTHTITYPFTLTHWWMQATIQGAGLTIRSNFGFSVLLKDTLTYGQELLGTVLTNPALPPKPRLPHVWQPGPGGLYLVNLWRWYMTMSTYLSSHGPSLVNGLSLAWCQQIGRPSSDPTVRKMKSIWKCPKPAFI